MIAAGDRPRAPRAPATPGSSFPSRRWPSSDPRTAGSSGCWAPAPSSPPPTATSAARSTTRSGLVAIYAAGMTPVVFVIAGLIFAATAATYAEATTMFPEAGGLLELRPARLQRVLVLLRGVEPDAHVHHHDRHLGVLRAALPRASSGSRSSESPGDIIGGIVVVAPARRPERGRREGVGRREHRLRDRRLHDAGAARGAWASCSCSTPTCWCARWTSAPRPTIGDFLIAIPVAMVAYTGIETISNMAEEARDVGKTIPRGIGLVVGRGGRDLRVPARGGALRHAGRGRRDPARAAEGGGGLRGRPRARRGGEHGPRRARRAPPRSTSGCSRPRSSSSPPTRACSACRG